ncbi:hypothetical protein NUW58_g670 [Xylaria curta]|uniref:Uncharacterized protein n=1 Tax=Xylaria curta TaxID=42375 RepID=A0ACC1PNB4_9PEZI|nr:hypothetical protein NUW58_g670 [Xylaria curta]
MIAPAPDCTQVSYKHSHSNRIDAGTYSAVVTGSDTGTGPIATAGSGICGISALPPLDLTPALSALDLDMRFTEAREKLPLSIYGYLNPSTKLEALTTGSLKPLLSFYLFFYDPIVIDLVHRYPIDSYFHLRVDISTPIGLLARVVMVLSDPALADPVTAVH